MVKVIMGKKGSGKTKHLIELINNAIHEEAGSVVCIERNRKLTYDIHYNIRLVEASDYDLGNFDILKGMIQGLYAGNYDITHIFIDSLCRVVPCDGGPEVEEMLDWMEGFSVANGVKFTVTISDDADLAKEGVRKYFDTQF